VQAIVEGRDYIRTPDEEDRASEAAVLRHVLALHPSPVTVAELVRELGSGEESFALRDAVERAVRDLAGCGLLHRSEALVLPSRAALRCAELLGD
jgi:type IV secretory pathway protease TraF